MQLGPGSPSRAEVVKLALVGLERPKSVERKRPGRDPGSRAVANEMKAGLRLRLMWGEGEGVGSCERSFPTSRHVAVFLMAFGMSGAVDEVEHEGALSKLRRPVVVRVNRGRNDGLACSRP